METLKLAIAVFLGSVIVFTAFAGFAILLVFIATNLYGWLLALGASKLLAFLVPAILCASMALTIIAIIFVGLE
jgi:hypothetical protein